MSSLLRTQGTLVSLGVCVQCMFASFVPVMMHFPQLALVRVVFVWDTEPSNNQGRYGLLLLYIYSLSTFCKLMPGFPCHPAFYLGLFYRWPRNSLLLLYQSSENHVEKKKGRLFRGRQHQQQPPRPPQPPTKKNRS